MSRDKLIQDIQRLIALEKKLIHDRDAILEWMDANDAHMSPIANEELRAINQQISEIQ